jgi:hypothetical protein
MAEERQVGPGLYVKLGMDLSSLVGAGGAAAIVLNQTLDLFHKFEQAAQMAYDNSAGKAIEYQEAIEDLHNTLGMTNSDAQKWKSTLVSFDTDVGSFSQSLRMLTQRVSDTSATGESLRATLKGIGVDVKDSAGNYKNASDMMQGILVALDHIPEGTRKANLENEIFSRGWQNIANLINNGTLAVEKFKEQQPLFSDDELDRIDKAKIKMGEFDQKMDAIKAKTGASLLENPGIKSLLDYLSGSGEYADNEAKWNKYQTAVKEGFTGDFNSWSANKTGADWTNKTITSDTGTPPAALLTGPETLQQKLDEITNTTLPKLKQAYLDAIPNGNSVEIASARKAYDDALTQQFDITNQIRDQNLSYQDMVDITLPHLKEALVKAKATGLKTDIEAAQIALNQGVNSANDLGVALGKAAISAADIKSSITIASGWKASDIIGSAGSEQAAFMIDEMEHGVKDAQTALNAWSQGIHSYITLANGEGTLGAAINGETPTVNLGANEREAQAAAAKSGTISTAGTGTGTKKSVSVADQSKLDTPIISTELSKQADLFSSLNDKIKDGWIGLEKNNLTHWTALTELSRIGEQAIMQNAYEAAAYAGRTPIIQKLVMLSKDGYDINPSVITVPAPITLAAADFSSVVMLSATKKDSSNSDTGSGKSGGTGNVTVLVTNKGNVEIDSIVEVSGDSLAGTAIRKGYN